MDEKIRQALAIDRSSTAWERTVDITTTGRRTGLPRRTFHVKHGAHADLPATAIPITDLGTRRRVFEYITDDMNQPCNPARIHQPTQVEDWMAGSPLVEVVFPP